MIHEQHGGMFNVQLLPVSLWNTINDKSQISRVFGKTNNQGSKPIQTRLWAKFGPSDPVCSMQRNHP